MNQGVTRALLLLSAILGLHAPIQAKALPAFLPETDEGIFLSNALQALTSFLESNGIDLYDKSFPIVRFRETADAVEYRFVSKTLKDRFGNPRCILNRGDSPTLEVSTLDGCLARLKQEPAELYSILAHEVLNMMGMELPSKESGSVYSLSKKLLEIDPSRIALQQKVIIHSSCDIFSVPNDYFAEEILDAQSLSIWSKERHYGEWRHNLTVDQVRYLHSKGYRYGGGQYDWEQARELSSQDRVQSPSPLFLEFGTSMRPTRKNKRFVARKIRKYSERDDIERPDVLILSLRLPARYGVYSESTAHLLYSASTPIKTRLLFAPNGPDDKSPQIVSQPIEPHKKVNQNLIHLPDCAAIPQVKGTRQ